METSSIDLSTPSVIKALKSKEKIREKEINKKDYKIQDPRVPKGQWVAKKWIQLDLGLPISSQEYNPWKKPEAFSLRFSGRLDKTHRLSLEELKTLGCQKYTIDFHCVLGWSVLNLEFMGIPFDNLLQYLKPKDDWACLYQIGADGYTVPVDRRDVENSGAFLALGDGEGKILSKEHGGVRFIFPKLYGWKSAKYLREIYFLNHYMEGFWEENGAHARGRIAEEEKWVPEAAKQWEEGMKMTNWYRETFGERIYFYAMQFFGRRIGDMNFNKGKNTKKMEFRFKVLCFLIPLLLFLFFLKIFFF